MGFLSDFRRSLRLARTLEFTCPGCRRVVPRDSLLYYRHRADCPFCHAVVLAPPGHPTGYVAAPPPVVDPPAAERLPALGFLPAATAGALTLYLFWMLPGMLKAAAVGYLGWRPIGWESTLLTALGLMVTGVFALVALSAGIVATRSVPGAAATAATIAAVLVPIVLFHAFVALPWGDRMTHASSWPADLPLVEFHVCAEQFDLGSDALAARGVVRFTVENRSPRPLRAATFSVKTGRPSDWLEHTAQYRYTVRNVAPGGRATVDERVYLGNILWKGGADYGGQGAAPAVLMWDDVEFAGGGSGPLATRPRAARTGPVPDCPGATRPEVPWYIRPYTGPE